MPPLDQNAPYALPRARRHPHASGQRRTCDVARDEVLESCLQALALAVRSGVPCLGLLPAWRCAPATRLALRGPAYAHRPLAPLPPYTMIVQSNAPGA